MAYPAALVSRDAIPTTGAAAGAPVQTGELVADEIIVASTTATTPQKSGRRTNRSGSRSYFKVQERYIFPELVKSFGTNWEAIAARLSNKSASQVWHSRGPRPPFRLGSARRPVRRCELT